MNSASSFLSSYIKPVVKRISRRFSAEVGKTNASAGVGESVKHAHSPQLSIVVPVYNVEGYIRETLDSLLSQTLEDWEAIIVDDGSTDTSPQIVNSYAAADSRFKVVRQANAGLGAARNAGIRAATGKFLTFLDSDDIIPPVAYEIAVKCLKRTKSDFAIGAVDRIKNGTRTTPKWTSIVHSAERTKVTIDDFPDMMMDVVACNRVFNREFWLKSVGEFPVGVAYEDHRVMVTASIRAKSIDVLADVTYLWRIREDNTSISQQKSELQNLLDRVRAKEETFNVLRAEASDSATSAWITRLLDTDIPLFAAHAVTSDLQYRECAAAFAKKYVELADDSAWDNVRWHQRVKVTLMAASRWDDLDLFLTQLRNNVDIPGTQILSGSVILDLSPYSFDFSFLPESRRVLGPRLTSLTARISSAEWTENGLELAGFALISNVAPTESDELSVEMVNTRTNSRVVLKPIRRVLSNFASRHANEAAFDHSPSGFEILIPWDQFKSIVHQSQFDMKDEWHIEVTRRNGAIERTAPADTVLRGGSGGAFAQSGLVNEPYSIQLHRHKRAFSIRFRPIHSELQNLVVQGGELAGQIYVPPSAAPEAPVSICAKGTHKQVAVSRLTPTSGEQNPREGVFSFEGLKLSALPPTSRLRVEFGDSTTKPVTWALPEAEYRFLPGLVLKKSPFGLIDIVHGQLSPVAESIQYESDEVTVDIRFSDIGIRPTACSLRSITSTDSIKGTVVADGREDCTATLKFNTRVRNSSGAAVRGTYSVFVDDTHVVPTLEMSRSFPSSSVTDFYRVEASRGSAPAGRPLNLKFAPPLTDSEVGSWNQKRLRRWYQQESFDVQENAVLFQCYRGEVATDNQLAIHNELVRRRSDIVSYWGVADRSVQLPTGSVPLVIGSKHWYEKLGTAKYLCNNIDFDHFFYRRPNQKFLQTFHGHAFKGMGATFWKANSASPQKIRHEIERRRQAWSAALMPNEESVQYYISEYDYDGEYLVAGFPRDDSIVNSDPRVARDRVSRFYDIDPSQSKWVLYAPTWRESSATGTWSAKMFDELDVSYLGSQLGDDWTILVRGHGHNARESARVNRGGSIVDVTDYPEINDLISSCDASILDYSSLRFDWAITRKPMVFFVPDKDEYFELRPALFSFEESAPGPLTSTTSQVIDELNKAESYEVRFGESLDSFNQRFNSLSDGRAAERVVEQFFNDKLY